MIASQAMGPPRGGAVYGAAQHEEIARSDMANLVERTPRARLTVVGTVWPRLGHTLAASVHRLAYVGK